MLNSQVFNNDEHLPAAGDAYLEALRNFCIAKRRHNPTNLFEDGFTSMGAFVSQQNLHSAEQHCHATLQAWVRTSGSKAEDLATIALSKLEPNIRQELEPYLVNNMVESSFEVRTFGELLKESKTKVFSKSKTSETLLLPAPRPRRTAKP